MPVGVETRVIDPRTGVPFDRGSDMRDEQEAYVRAVQWAQERASKRLRPGAFTQPELPSEFVQYRINFDAPDRSNPMGKSISLHLRPWQKAIYDSEYTKKRIVALGGDEASTRLARKTLVKAARQTEKSTGLGNKLWTFISMLSNICALYVTSAGLNMQEFADERVDNTLRISPRLKQFVGGFVNYNRFFKRLKRNNSRIVMRSAHLNANRVRGIAADVLAIDEIQDFVMANIPVITATLNNSELPFGAITLFSGTPLTFDNPIEQIWSKRSTKNLWLIPCDRCNHPNFPPQNPNEVDRMIGRKGLLCIKCGRALNPLSKHCNWVRTGALDSDFEGFHLSRCLMPYTSIYDRDRFAERWLAFYQDVNDPTASEASKMNEIFGVSWDSGKKPLSREELIRLCHPGITSLERLAPKEVLADPAWDVFMGIDWGEGTGDGAFTVVSMGYVNHVPEVGSVLQVFFMRRYMGVEADPRYLWDEISYLMEANHVDICFCDAGFGWGMIDGVRERIRDGMRRFIPMRYTNQSAIMSWDPTSNQFQCNKTRWMAKIFNQLKNRRVVLPSWEIMDGPPRLDGGFAQDILTIYADRSPKLRQMQYNHTDPDDAFHSLLYLMSAKMWRNMELAEFANS